MQSNIAQIYKLLIFLKFTISIVQNVYIKPTKKLNYVQIAKKVYYLTQLNISIDRLNIIPKPEPAAELVGAGRQRGGAGVGEVKMPRSGVGRGAVTEELLFQP